MKYFCLPVELKTRRRMTCDRMKWVQQSWGRIHGISFWFFFFCLLLTSNPNCFPIKCDINFLRAIVWNKWFIKWTTSSSILCLQKTCLFWQMYLLFLFVLPYIWMYAHKMSGYTSDTLSECVLILNSVYLTKKCFFWGEKRKKKKHCIVFQWSFMF